MGGDGREKEHRESVGNRGIATMICFPIATYCAVKGSARARIRVFMTFGRNIRSHGEGVRSDQSSPQNRPFLSPWWLG